MRVAKNSYLYKRLNIKNFIFNYQDFFIQALIKRGLKKKAIKIFRQFGELLNKNFLIKNSLNEFLKEFFDKKKPTVGFVLRKVASVTYTIPVYIRPDRARSIILRWFIDSALTRTEKSFPERLYFEFIDLFNAVGRTVRKIEEYYKLAIKNRPFTKFKKKRSRRYRSFRRRKFGV